MSTRKGFYKQRSPKGYRFLCSKPTAIDDQLWAAGAIAIISTSAALLS